uniref:Uncharacterized protein n=1 Tax=Arundo donax TaxID=35708 RepID=A0A0A8ZRF0_ARUDO
MCLSLPSCKKVPLFQPIPNSNNNINVPIGCVTPYWKGSCKFSQTHIQVP